MGQLVSQEDPIDELFPSPTRAELAKSSEIDRRRLYSKSLEVLDIKCLRSEVARKVHIQEKANHAATLADGFGSTTGLSPLKDLRVSTKEDDKGVDQFEVGKVVGGSELRARLDNRLIKVKRESENRRRVVELSMKITAKEHQMVLDEEYRRKMTSLAPLKEGEDQSRILTLDERARAALEPPVKVVSKMEAAIQKQRVQLIHETLKVVESLQHEHEHEKKNGWNRGHISGRSGTPLNKPLEVTAVDRLKEKIKVLSETFHQS